jgi:hypothetical protein
VHKKVRQLSCQGRQRPHRCGIEFRSNRIQGLSDAHGTQHKEYPRASRRTGLTEEQIQGLVKHIRGLTQQATPHAAPKP